MTLLTEAHAKTKWCPHARTYVSADILVSANRRGTGPDPECLCLASACMAWRWEGYRKPVDRETEGRGYCGAFGIPLESIV
jgi:hypothetical protein